MDRTLTSNPKLVRPHSSISHSLKVADAIWVATALLHQKNPETAVFTTDQIVNDVQDLYLTNATYRSIWQHVNQHCVANREPQPNRSRMLFATGQGNRRLFRDGDHYTSGRADAPTHPDWAILPTEFSHLRQWYEQEWNDKTQDPLLALVGTWTFGHAEDYLREIRSGWEDQK